MTVFMPASQQTAQIGRIVCRPTVRMPHRDRVNPPFGLAQHGDLTEPSPADAIPRDMQQHLHRSGELTVQCRLIEAAERAQCLQPGGNLARVVGVHGARPAIVAGVQCRQKIDHFGTADLADHNAVGPHPQCLPDELAHRDLADTFDVGAPGDQLDQMRMPRRQLGSILHAHDPLIR
jgi:hypothetical protein